MPKKSKKSKLPRELTTVTKVSKLTALFLFIALPVLAFYIGTHYPGIFKFESSAKLPKTISYEQYNNSPQKPIEKWEIYSNKEFGFSFKYPAMGYEINPLCYTENENCDELTLITCEPDIDQTSINNAPHITIANFLSVSIQKFNGSVADYISKNGGVENYVEKLVNVAGTDDAVFLTSVKQGAFQEIPPIVPPVLLVKKGNNLFTIMPLQNPGNSGCLPPAGTKGNIFDSKYWNIPQSFTFN